MLAVFGLLRVYALGLKHGPLRLEILAWRDDLTESRKYFGWLGEHHPPGATIAAGLIGHTGHFTDMPVYDIFGVIDPKIAHKEVQNFGKGKAGHEKKATLAEILQHKPTYIVPGYLAGNYWQLGYFWSNDSPTSFTKRGIWQRDQLLDTGSYIESTRLDFTSLPEGATLEGEAFSVTPRAAPKQRPPLGVQGWFLSSYNPTSGAAATGRFRTAPFLLEGEELVYRVGGEYDVDKLRVSLLVEDKELCHATGHDDEFVGRRSCDIAAHRGKRAVFQVVDDADWGGLVVDEVVQWRRQSP